MIGKKVLAFIHHDDHKELTKQFMISMPPSMSLPTTDEVDENEDEGWPFCVCVCVCLCVCVCFTTNKYSMLMCLFVFHRMQSVTILIF